MASHVDSSYRSMKPFFIIWTGQAVSLFGSQLVQFALIWWLTRETGSATVLALASIVALVPQAIMGPIAGTLVDRWNRRNTMLIADSLVALVSLLLALLFVTHKVEIWQVYAVMFVRALGASFHWPAMAASTTLMVPDNQLARIQGLNQTLQGGLNIISAPLAAILLGFMAVAGILVLDFITALAAVLPLLFIEIPQPEKNDLPASSEMRSQGRSAFWSEFKQGIDFLRSWPGLLIILLMATLINFVLTPAFALLPLMVTEHFQGGALQLGWLESAWGIGVVAGGILLGIWGGFKRRIVTSLLGLCFMGLFTAAFGLVPPPLFVAAVVLIFMVGLMNPFINGPVLALIQSLVAPDMQGRIFGLVASGVAIMSPLGLVIAGILTDSVGLRIWFVAGGLTTMAIGLTGFLLPAVFRIEEDHQGQIAPALESTSGNVIESSSQSSASAAQ